MAIIHKNKTTKNSPSRFTPQPQLTPEEQFWDEVDQLSQEKICQVLTNNIPLPNLKLITEPYRYEDKQQTLTGLFLHKDVDYRTLLADYQAQYSGTLPEANQVAHEIAYEYLLEVSKSIINSLKEFTCHDPEYLEGVV